MSSVEQAIDDVQRLDNVRQDDGNLLSKFGRGMPKLKQMRKRTPRGSPNLP